MKRDEWIVILIVVVGGGLTVILGLSGWPRFDCHWNVEKKYNVTVNSKEDAVNLLNEYLVPTFKQNDVFGGHRNITVNEITIVGDEFVDNVRDFKISRNGTVSEQYCLPGN